MQPSEGRDHVGRRPLPAHLPRRVVVVDVPEAEKLCSCGSAKQRKVLLFIVSSQVTLRKACADRAQFPQTPPFFPGSDEAQLPATT